MKAYFNQEQRLVKTVDGKNIDVRKVGGEATGVDAESVAWTPIDPNYNQLCVFQNFPRQKTNDADMVERLAKQFSLRLKYAESIEKGSGCSDVLFYVHSDDIGRMVIGPKKKYQNIKWLEETENSLPEDVKDRYPKLW